MTAPLPNNSVAVLPSGQLETTEAENKSGAGRIQTISNAVYPDMVSDSEAFLAKAMRKRLPAVAEFIVTDIIEKADRLYQGTTTCDASIAWWHDGDCYHFPLGSIPTNIMIRGGEECVTLEVGADGSTHPFALSVSLRLISVPSGGKIPSNLVLKVDKFFAEETGYHGALAYVSYETMA